jgi:uncharacterized membrane protein YkvI
LKNRKLIFQIAAVFIGTIVGAGLASGQEITQFFTVYGGKSMWGILLCFAIYLIVGKMVISISLHYDISSYKELIELVSKGFLGQFINLSTGFFLISSAAIILAGSGSLLKEYFHCSRWVGIILMALVSLYVLLRDTRGLIEINSFIVPALISIILISFTLYIIFWKNNIDLSKLLAIPAKSNFYVIYYINKFKLSFLGHNVILISSILYAGFNILSCSGVLVPLSKEIKEKKSLLMGVFLGAAGLTVLTLIMNFLLLVNQPYIYKYDIPMLYIVNRFGNLIQILLLCVIWLEMFSTEVSDIYSLGKTMEKSLNIKYNSSVVLIIILAVPVSQIGFVSLISVLYPLYGLISFIFMVQCIIFYLKRKKELE